MAYDGTRGYQPVVVLWAEQDVILHDQFRDGHVPAGCGNLRVLQQAVANLPQGITADPPPRRQRAVRNGGPPLVRGPGAPGSRTPSAPTCRSNSTPRSSASRRRPGRSSARSRTRSGPGPRSRTSPTTGITGRTGPVSAATSRCACRSGKGSLFADGSNVHYFAVVTNRHRGRPRDPPVAPGEGRHGGAHPSRPQDRARRRRPPQWEVRGERRVVPVERPHLQSAHRAQAVDLTRRSPDRPAEAAAVPALQHRREGRRACPPDALAALGGPPACPTPSGPA